MRQSVRPCDLGISRFSAAQRPALCQQLRSRRPVDTAIHAATAQKRFICRRTGWQSSGSGAGGHAGITSFFIRKKCKHHTGNASNHKQMLPGHANIINEIDPSNIMKCHRKQDTAQNHGDTLQLSSHIFSSLCNFNLMEANPRKAQSPPDHAYHPHRNDFRCRALIIARHIFPAFPLYAHEAAPAPAPGCRRAPSGSYLQIHV